MENQKKKLEKQVKNCPYEQSNNDKEKRERQKQHKQTKL